MHVSAFHPFRSAKARERYLRYYDQKAARWPVPAECQLVETSFGQTFVRISGAADLPPLVLLPGGSASSLMWLPNVAAFSAHFRTIAVDNLYDFGRSIYSRKPRDVGDLMRWLNELFDALALGNRVHLLGLSLGGWIAAQYALHCPERIARVALLAPANTVLMIQPEFALRAFAMLLPLRRFTANFVYWLFADLAGQRPDGPQKAEELIDELYLSLRCFRRMPLITPTVFTDDELRAFQPLAVLLVGEHEKIYPAQAAVARLGHFAPTWRAEIIPAAGHDLTFSQPEVVNRKVADFLLESS
jgi:pimeloyl-ACP methyl ester carboxylesterase